MSELITLKARHDFYAPVHKAIRKALSELLIRLGVTDWTDTAERTASLAALRQQMRFSASHLEHEETEIHGALELRSPGATQRLDAAHEEHDRAYVEIEGLCRALETCPADAKVAAGRALYLRFTQFVGEDFLHMAEEETVTLPRLWALFTDEELIGMEARIVGSMPPEELMAGMGLMIPAMNRQERAGFLSFVRAGAPPEAFAAILGVVKPALAANDWDDLAGWLQLAA